MSVGALEALADNWSRFLGAICPAGWIPHPLPGFSSSPLSHPDVVSDISGRISLITGLAPGSREDVVQGCLGNRPRSRSCFYSCLFLGEKVTGGLASRDRPLSPERVCSAKSVQDGDCTSVLMSVREGDFLSSIDLKDAYFQIPVHQSSRKLLRFLSEGTVYQFKALCFGLLTAPQVFTKMFAAMSVWAHSHRIRLLRYLDDWLVLASSEAEAKRNVQDLLSVCHSLGIVINEEKSDLVPLQTANYLGMTIDTGAARIFPSHVLVKKFVGGGDVLCCVRSPRSALAGGFGSPGFAGEASSSQSTSNVLSAVAFEDTLVSRVGSSLPSGAFVPGGERICLGGW